MKEGSNGSIGERRERTMPEIRRSQEELRASLETLQATVRRQFDIRRRIAEDPVPWLLAGVLVGLWLGRPRR